MDLRAGVQIIRSELKPSEDITTDLPPLHGQLLTRYGTGLDYRFTPRLALSSDFHIMHSESLDSDRSSDAWQIIETLSFQRPRFTGHLGAGFGQGDTGEDRKTTRFLMRGRVNVPLGRRISVGADLSRQYSTSAFLESDFRVVTRAGVNATFRLTHRISLGAAYTRGYNDYGNNTINGETINNDTFETARLLLHLRTIRFVSVQLGIAYTRRDTDIPGLDKERFLYLLGVGVAYTFSFP